MPEVSTIAAVPGNVVRSGSILTPGGDQGMQGIQGSQGVQGMQGIQGVTGNTGPQGSNAYTLTTADFAVPGVGQQVTVNVLDTNWIVVGQMLYVDTAGGGAGQTGCFKVTAKTGNSITLSNVSTTAGIIIPEAPLDGKRYGRLSASWSSDPIQADAPSDGKLYTRQNAGWTPSAVQADAASDGGYYNRRNGLWVPRPLADATQSGLLTQLSGNTTDFVSGANTTRNLQTDVQPIIWYQRTRTYNSLGNPSLEIDQRNVGAALTNPAAGVWPCDRWRYGRSAGAYNINIASTYSTVTIPGTSFPITSRYIRFTNQAVVATAGASDFVQFYQQVEGPSFRELNILTDVHTIWLLVRSSVAPLTLSLGIYDSPLSMILAKLFTISTAGAWQLISLSSLPAFPGGAGFTALPGYVGYIFCINLVLGSNYTVAPNVWTATTTANGATGAQSFGAQPVGSTLDIAFCQHEPGVGSSLIDKPFSTNHQECLRYYFKSADYGVVPGTSANGECWMTALSATYAFGTIPFPVPMAQSSTLTTYNSVAAPWTANQCTSYPGGVNYTVTGKSWNTKALDYLSISGGVASQQYRFSFTADSGW